MKNELISETILNLIIDEKNRYYAHLLMQMNIVEDYKIKTGGVNVTNKINLYYNPDFLSSLSKLERVEFLIHECSHVYQNHFGRFDRVGAGINDPIAFRIANIAADASINEDLKNLTKNLGVTIDRLNKQFIEVDKNFVPLKRNKVFEYYYERIRDFRKNNDLPNGLDDLKLDDHSIWKNGETNEEIRDQVVKQIVNKAVERSGGIGNIPSNVVPHIQKLNKSKTNWKAVLNNFFVSTQNIDKEHTRLRRNRRYGIMQKGRKKKPNLHIAFIVDTSGSMSDKALSQAWAELNKIKNTVNSRITVIEADCIVQDVYEFDSKTIPKFKGRGGTAYQPAIEKAMELNVDGIAFYGDFDSSDTPKDPRKPFLWVGVGNQKPPAEFGKTIRIEVENEYT